MPDILIIGYGNQLREDDAVGCVAADQLKQHFRNRPDIRVIAAQQLAPEMAEDISHSMLVLFLDASCGGAPGAIRLKRVLPQPGPSGFTHQLSPASLLATATQLYGGAAEGKSLTLACWSFNISDRISSDAQARLPEFVRQAKEVVEAFCVTRPLS